ncbi:MAG: GAF and ANTAR domain-containing protein [Nocardioides sp.]
MARSATGAERLAAALRELQTTAETPATLERIATGADELFGPCDGCGLTLRDRKGNVTAGTATSPLARECDALQYELREGPCLDAVAHQDMTLVEDLERERRWPVWTPHAVAAGVRSLLSIRLFTSEATMGALNLYSLRRRAFDHDAVELGWVYAGGASAALRAAHRADGLSAALETRHMIGLAQGILMSRYDVSADRAFDVLRRYSSQHNLKLRDVAQTLVEDGVLPLEEPEA